MSALATLVLAAAAAAPQEPATLPAGAGGADPPTAAWWTSPGAVDVGQPFRWRLEVRHPEGALRELDEQREVFRAGLDPSWVLLEPEPTLALPDPDREGWVRTRTGWRAVSLEAGERSLPPFEVRFTDGTRVATPDVALTVRPVLAEGEDAPRPPRDFRVLSEEPRSNVALVAGGAAGLALALLFWLWWRSGRWRPDEDETTGEDRLRAKLSRLQREVPEGPALRDVFYDLSALLRRAVDERAGADRRGLTDDEWLGAVRGDGTLPPEARADLERFLARCAEIKYAAHEPSPWAVREELATVRSVLERTSPDDEEADGEADEEPGGNGAVRAAEERP